jgi:hypothetical protein
VDKITGAEVIAVSDGGGLDPSSVEGDGTVTGGTATVRESGTSAGVVAGGTETAGVPDGGAAGVARVAAIDGVEGVFVGALEAPPGTRACQSAQASTPTSAPISTSGAHPFGTRDFDDSVRDFEAMDQNRNGARGITHR